MCLAFVTVDLGRPDRFWHMIPGIGKLNFPGSLLSWDVIVLNGYLVLNVYLCAYLLYCRYRKQAPSKWFYLPVVFRHRLGNFHPHGDGVPLCGTGRAAVLDQPLSAPVYHLGSRPVLLIISPAGGPPRHGFRAGGWAGDRAGSSGRRPHTRRSVCSPVTCPNASVPAEAFAKAAWPAPGSSKWRRRSPVAPGARDHDAYLVLGRVVVKREEGGRDHPTGPGEIR
jgi:hypothetical protein